MASAGLYEPSSRALRASLYAGVPARGHAHAGMAPFAFALTFLAVFASFTISGNTLNVLGTHYADQGGNPLLKIHPATYLAAMAAMASVASGSFHGRGLGYVFGKAPALCFFIGLTIFCTLFAYVNVGITGVGIYIDNYLSAGGLAIAMFSASERQRRILARLILFLCMVNVLISLAEYVHQEHFIPLDIKSDNGKVYSDDGSDEFRPTALYTHPLTGAMATAFALFLVIETRLRFRSPRNSLWHLCGWTSWLRWPGGAGRYDRTACGAGDNHFYTGFPQRPGQRPFVGNDSHGSLPSGSPSGVLVNRDTRRRTTCCSRVLR